MLTKRQAKKIKAGVKSMREEGAPGFLIEDYINDMVQQFEEENEIDMFSNKKR